MVPVKLMWIYFSYDDASNTAIVAEYTIITRDKWP